MYYFQCRTCVLRSFYFSLFRLSTFLSKMCRGGCSEPRKNEAPLPLPHAKAPILPLSPSLLPQADFWARSRKRKRGRGAFLHKGTFLPLFPAQNKAAAVRVGPSIFSPPSDQHENRTFLPKRGVGGSSSSSLWYNGTYLAATHPTTTSSPRGPSLPPLFYFSSFATNRARDFPSFVLPPSFSPRVCIKFCPLPSAAGDRLPVLPPPPPQTPTKKRGDEARRERKEGGPSSSTSHKRTGGGGRRRRKKFFLPSILASRGSAT